MPLVGAPTFAPGVLTADQLNSLVSLLENKFSGGIVSADISWPLTAGGNIDMVQFEILNLYKLWNVRNLAERDSGTTLQEVFDDVNSEGGGVVLLPANSEEIVGTGGVEVGPNTLIMGQGRTSIFSTSGTATNHMFRNMAHGDSGIKFVNCKLDNSGTAGGAFDIIGFTRVSACQLVDVWMVVDAEHGLSLETNSAGSTNTNVEVVRGQFDVTGGVSALSATDALGFKVRGAKFNLSGGAALLYAALGAASIGEDIIFEGNEVVVDDAYSSSSEYVVSLTGGNTNGLSGCSVSHNQIQAGAAVIDRVIDVLGTNAGVGTKIFDNTIVANGVAEAIVRVQAEIKGDYSQNTISSSGDCIGMLIGGTTSGGTENACVAFTCSGNKVLVDNDAAYVFVHPGVGVDFNGAVISGNYGECAAATGCFQLWNVGSATTTTRVFHLAIFGNNASESAYGWETFSAMGTSQGGSPGIANDSYLTVTGNIFPATDFADSGGDFANSIDAGATVHYVQIGNVT